MRVNGALERAAFECLASNPAAAIPARVWFNTVDGKTYLDDGTLVRALLRNDGKALIGNSGTASENIRLHRGAASVLQLVAGSDVTAEGTLSTALAQVSARQENYTDGTKPAPGNAGRIAWVSDLNQFQGDTGSAWSPLGGGGSGGGINFVGLSTAFALTSGADFDLEASVGNHVAYADAAGVTPVDMTGGSPGTTVTRSTSSPLNGAASLLMDLGTGSSRQGEGHSLVVNIPTGYRGLRLEYSFAFAVTGALVEDDLRLSVYDVTNATLITDVLQVNKVVGSKGIARLHFSTSTTTAQIRVGLHVARTTTTALSVKMDDFQVGPKLSTIGFAGSEWAEYPLTIGATTTPPTKGTTVRDKAEWRKVGDSIEIRYDFEQSGAGTAGTGTYLFPLPPGLSIDTSKIALGSTQDKLSAVGHGYMSTSADAGVSARYLSVAAYDASNLALYLDLGATFGIVSDAAADLGNAQQTYSFTAKVPIAGWSSNVSIGSSTTFNIASYLANGTRVTGTAPTKLGEYRSYLRDAGARTFSETNGAPTIAPSAANGVALYKGANTFAAGDANNEPSKYEFFVGKNKTVKGVAFASTGRTGFVDITPNLFATEATGFLQHYDPSTGILTVLPPTQGGQTSRVAGRDSNGDDVSTTIYYDAIISENALSVGVDIPRSEILAVGGSGHGSTNDKIRCFTSATSQGSGIEYSSDAVNGDSFTIMENGVYAISYTDSHSSAAAFGVSVNSTELTTAIQSILSANHVVESESPAGGVGCAAVSLVLVPGDVVRAHTEGTLSSANANFVKFRITKVSS